MDIDKEDIYQDPYRGQNYSESNHNGNSHDQNEVARIDIS